MPSTNDQTTIDRAQRLYATQKEAKRSVSDCALSGQPTLPSYFLSSRGETSLCSVAGDSEWHFDSYIRPIFISTRRCVR